MSPRRSRPFFAVLSYARLTVESFRSPRSDLTKRASLAAHNNTNLRTAPRIEFTSLSTPADLDLWWVNDFTLARNVRL